MVVAQVGIGGYTRIGRNVVLLGQAGVVHGRTIGDNTVVGAASAVTGDLPADAVFWGIPAQPIVHYKRQLVALRRLPKLLRTLGPR
jgi:UDP-3-O-[3-hydroxymyristoyl] glucosamine N-acyltransferase